MIVNKFKQVNIQAGEKILFSAYLINKDTRFANSIYKFPHFLG